MQLAKLQKSWIVVLLAIAALVAMTCGDSATATLPPTATLTPAPAPTSDASESPVAIDRDGLRRYLNAVGPAFRQARLDRQAVDRELTAPAPGRSIQVDDAAAWFRRVGDVKQRLVDDLQDVDRPAGLGSIHDEFVLAMSEWVALAERVLEVLADAGPEFNVGRDLGNVPELGIANAGRLNDRARFFCASIERLAADNGIDADLGCIMIVR